MKKDLRELSNESLIDLIICCKMALQDFYTIWEKLRYEEKEELMGVIKDTKEIVDEGTKEALRRGLRV